jgi:hypothetical protein
MNLDNKRKQAELMRVKAARMELEVKIEERLEEIERLKQHIEIQIKKEQELEKEIK